MSDALEEWNALREQLSALVAHIEKTEGSNRLYAFADGVLATMRAYERVIHAEGKTSIRVQAALKALTLSTAKSRIQAFLGDGSSVR